MNIDKGNVWNQFLVSSVLVSLAVTKVLGQIRGSLPGRGVRGSLPPALHS